MKTRKLLLITSIVLYPVAWVTSVFRFDSAIFSGIFKILFFPFGYIYLLMEKTALSNGKHAILDNEITEFAVWFLMITLQIVLFTILVKYILSIKKRNNG